MTRKVLPHENHPRTTLREAPGRRGRRSMVSSSSDGPARYSAHTAAPRTSRKRLRTARCPIAAARAGNRFSVLHRYADAGLEARLPEQKQDQVLPGSALGKAISFALGQWSKLIRYLDHPQLTLDNNSCEQAIRLFAIGEMIDDDVRSGRRRQTRPRLRNLPGRGRRGWYGRPRDPRTTLAPAHSLVRSPWAIAHLSFSSNFRNTRAGICTPAGGHPPELSGGPGLVRAGVPGP